jgi:hypothetical protein
MRPTPTQGQLLAKSREEARLARKRRYQRVIGIGLGGAGLASAAVGLPFQVSVMLWAFATASWAILRAV